MYINPSLIDDLDDLTEPLAQDDCDLSGIVRLLANAAELAVPSLLGWKVDFTVHGQPLSLTSIRPRADVGGLCASLHIPLSSLLTLSAEGGATLYAAQPGAFDVLAADLAVALHVPAEVLLCDQDLDPDLTSGLTGLRELSATNRAIGVLVERGHTMASARAQVELRSSVTELDLHRLRHSP